MRTIAKIVSFIALAATLVPCLLYFFGMIDHASVKWITLVGTAAWFGTTPLWMHAEPSVDAAEIEI